MLHVTACQEGEGGGNLGPGVSVAVGRLLKALAISPASDRHCDTICVTIEDTATLIVIECREYR